MEENMRFLEEMMRDGGGMDNEASQKIEQCEKKLRLFEEQLKQSETKLRMKSQQENELGKVIKHLEEKCMEEQFRNKQAQEEIKLVQSQTQCQGEGASVWRQKFLEEEAKHKATQDDLAQTEVLLAEQSQVSNKDVELNLQKSEEKVKKLEERFTNMKGKARAKISEKDTEIQELAEKAKTDAEMIITLTTNCQEAVLRLAESQSKLQELEGTTAKQSSLRGKYEYKINFLEEKLKKASSEKGGDVAEHEAKIKLMEEKLSDSISDLTKTSNEYKTKIDTLEARCKEAEENNGNSTKTLIQQTNTIRNN